MFESLKSLSSGTSSERVEFDATRVVRTLRDGRTESVCWDDLVEVIIVTTDEGPFVDDVFWLLVGENGGCAVGSEAVGMDALLSRLQSLPSFDNEAVIRAMCCSDNARFVAWRKRWASS